MKMTRQPRLIQEQVSCHHLAMALFNPTLVFIGEVAGGDTRDGGQLKSAACQHEDAASFGGHTFQVFLMPSQLTIQLSPLKALNHSPGVDWNAARICRECPEVSGPFLRVIRRKEQWQKFLCVLLVIGVAARMGYLRETASEYVLPSETVPRAKLSRCRFNC